MASNELDAAILRLATYLQAEVPELLSVSPTWPDPKQPLITPCASIILQGNPSYIDLMPTIYSRIVDPGDANKDLVRYMAGQYEMNLQIDLWCEYKLERADIYQKVANAFNKQFIIGLRESTGLTLELDDYYSMFAAYDIVGYNFPEDEQSSQRSEWRVMVQVSCIHSKIVEKSEYRMEEITLKHEISSDRDPETDNIDIQENVVI